MKKNQNYLIFMIVFYVLVAFFAFAFLSRDLSVFNRKYSDEVIEAQNTETVVGRVEKAEESTTEATAEVETKTEIEEVVAAIEATSEAPAETEAEPAEEPATEPATEAEIVYYSYVTNNTESNLRVREEPSLNAKVLKRLYPGSKGYVLEKDDEWCKVVASGDTIGYCSTEFLDLEEIAKEDFPAEYVELVTSTR
ncbi:SH3 domain-containing protein [Butyrivibrio sp. Su6]|uniref:SH3 domain-containing protein n=1 Tax=Butyrivibrio sp. Su6 TaxID=1520810 RepID=UPI00089E913E|nr:SH3 domain-containing protein [Butyrivibrio sp. Su6]SEF38965.1 SH3 domain-containing protein [Butyrivibrio sp. Su6]